MNLLWSWKNETQGQILQIHGENFMCPIEKAFLRPLTSRVDRYKLYLALIVEGVSDDLDNNVGIDIDILSIIDNLNIFFYYPWGKVGTIVC